MNYYRLSYLFIIPVLIMSIFFPISAIGFANQDIPEPARCYFSAVAASDLTALTRCFRPDAVIIDVNRKIAGIGAIRAWAENEVIGGHYKILSIVSQTEERIKILITFVPPGFGDQSSRGFDAHYTFDFKQGKIIGMDLQYA